MIKLDAVPSPIELTPDVVKELTEKFKLEKTSVWQKDYIREALLKMSNGKCCYCECEVNVAGSDLHVEHFHPKKIYENEVLRWDNLLPSCVRCNRNKGTLDTKKTLIVHPIRNNPKNHFKISNFYFHDKDELGDFTIERLQLNDDERLALDRFKLGTAVMKQLNELTKEFIEIVKTKSILTDRQQTKFGRKLQSIMRFGTAEKKYSAVISSVILADKNYQEIKRLFMTHKLWNDEFIELEEQVNYCALI
jgi:hypothetical protein